MNSNIIVNVGDLCSRRYSPSTCRCRGGQGRAVHSRGGRNGIRIESRSRRKRSLIVSPTSSTMSFFDSSSRLLLPTVRGPRAHSQPPLSHRSPKIKSSSSRSSRTRLVSPPPEHPEPSLTTGQLWLGKNANFEIVHDQLQLDGFQLFAVEKWFVLLSSSFLAPREHMNQGHGEDQAHHNFDCLHRKSPPQGHLNSFGPSKSDVTPLHRSLSPLSVPHLRSDQRLPGPSGIESFVTYAKVALDLGT